MRAELDQRVNPLATRQPEMEGDIGMARRQSQIMIVALAACAAAAVGLNGDDQLAEPGEAEAERIVNNLRVGLRRAPCGFDGALEFPRRRREFRCIVGKRQRRQRNAFRQRDDQRLCVGRGCDVIACGAQDTRDDDGARGRVESDRIARAAAARRIVGQHTGEPLLGRRQATQPRPSRCEIGDEVDAVGKRRVRRQRRTRSRRCVALRS